jgi:hypothetical protein
VKAAPTRSRADAGDNHAAANPADAGLPSVNPSRHTNAPIGGMVTETRWCDDTSRPVAGEGISPGPPLPRSCATTAPSTSNHVSPGSRYPQTPANGQSGWTLTATTTDPPRGTVSTWTLARSVLRLHHPPRIHGGGGGSGSRPASHDGLTTTAERKAACDTFDWDRPISRSPRSPSGPGLSVATGGRRPPRKQGRDPSRPRARDQPVRHSPGLRVRRS